MTGPGRALMRRRVRLEGAQALVTGAGGPVGRAVAVALAEEGSDVVCVDADEVAGATTAASCADRGVTSRAVAADVGDADAATALAGELAAEVGRFDVLVNVGLGGPSGRLADLGPAGWAAGRARGLDAVVHACQLLAPVPGGRRRAQIVNVVPAAALLAGPDQAVVAATGAGVAALSLAMRADRSHGRVGVSLVVAGRTATAVTATPGPRRNGRPRGGQAPEAVAAAVLRAIRTDRAVIRCGIDARLACHLRRLLPVAAGRLAGRSTRSLRRAPAPAVGAPAGTR